MYHQHPEREKSACVYRELEKRWFLYKWPLQIVICPVAHTVFLSQREKSTFLPFCIFNEKTGRRREQIVNDGEEFIVCGSIDYILIGAGSKNGTNHRNVRRFLPSCLQRAVVPSPSPCLSWFCSSVLSSASMKCLRLQTTVNVCLRFGSQRSRRWTSSRSASCSVPSPRRRQ